MQIPSSHTVNDEIESFYFLGMFLTCDSARSLGLLGSAQRYFVSSTFDAWMDHGNLEIDEPRL